MSRNLGKTDAPPAVRAGRPGWRDPRLWIGVALVAASVLVGARLLGGADRTIEVWAASGDLAAGQPVSQDDLVARRVDFADDVDADRYLQVSDDLPDAATLARAVGAGSWSRRPRSGGPGPVCWRCRSGHSPRRSRPTSWPGRSSTSG